VLKNAGERRNQGLTMGWNISCVFINARENGYLGTFPAHSANSARTLLEDLGLKRGTRSRFSTFSDGINPPAGWFGVGAYAGAYLVSGHDDLYGCGYDSEKPLLKKCLEIFPQSSILAMELASSTNYFAYRLYCAGDLVRALAGDAERGTVVDTGPIQLEEAPFFRDSTLKGRERSFRIWKQGRSWEYSCPEMGETLTFAVAGRFLGTPLDEYRYDQLQVELVGKVRRGLFK
jgi:hypothetical protein